MLLETWGIWNFTLRFFREVFKPPYNLNELVKQFFQIGNKSLGLVGVTGFIIGFVLALQAIPTLQPFGATSLIPSMIGLSIILEIGPVISGLICAGKIGSSMSVDLCSNSVRRVTHHVPPSVLGLAARGTHDRQRQCRLDQVLPRSRLERS